QPLLIGPSLCTVPSPTDLCPLSLHDALPIYPGRPPGSADRRRPAMVRHGRSSPHLPTSQAALSGTTSSFWREVIDSGPNGQVERSEEHTSELQSREKLVCRLLLEKKKHTHTE